MKELMESILVSHWDQATVMWCVQKRIGSIELP